MNHCKINDSEYRLCEILWDNEPINSTELMKLCREKLGWSKATTYTVIRRLSERGIIQNVNSIVTSLVSREEAQTAEIRELLENKFSGSLPAFMAAFVRSEKPDEKEYEELSKIIENWGNSS